MLAGWFSALKFAKLEREQVLDSAFAAIAFCFFVAFFVPFYPTMAKAGLDPSWQQTMAYAFDHRLRAGKEIIFTQGPLSVFGLNLFDENYYSALLWVRLTVALVIALALAEILRPLPLLPRLLFLAAIYLGFWSYIYMDSRFVTSMDSVWLCVPLLAVALIERGDSQLIRWLTHGLIVICALISLVKFSFAVLCLAVVPLVDLQRFFRYGNRMPVFSVAYVGAVWALFVLSGQRTADFDAFLQGSMNLLSGYSEAMQYQRGWREAVAVAAFLFLTLVSLVLFMSVRYGKGTYRPIPSIVLCSSAVTLFMFFKAGLTRSDHIPCAFGGLLAVSSLHGVEVWRQKGVLRPIKVLTGGVMAIEILLVYSSISLSAHKGPAAIVKEQALQIRDNVASFRSWLTGRHIDRLKSLADRQKQSINEASQLPKIEGTIDVYPWDQAAVLARGMALKPRPIFQSYSVYTPYLIEKNLQFLRSGQSANTLLFDLKTIDGRFPSQDDGASWPELLTRYDLNDLLPQFLELKKRSVQREYAIKPLYRIEVRFGEAFSLPRGIPLVWAQIGLEKNLLGRWVNTLYKLPEIKLVVTYAHNREEKFRLIPGITGKGFLLSPVVRDRFDFAALALGQPMESQDDPVVSMRIEWNTPARLFYGRIIPISFSELTFPASSQAVHLPLQGQSRLWTQIGDGYRQTNFLAKAARAYEHAIKLDPGNGKLSARLGLTYFALGRYQRALDVCREALRLNSEDSLIAYCTGASREAADYDAKIAPAHRRLESQQPDRAREFADLIRRGRPLHEIPSSR